MSRDIADVNAGLCDAEKSIMQPRGALGRGDAGEALNQLARAFAIIRKSMQDLQPPDPGIPTGSATVIR